MLSFGLEVNMQGSAKPLAQYVDAPGLAHKVGLNEIRCPAPLVSGHEVGSNVKCRGVL